MHLGRKQAALAANRSKSTRKRAITAQAVASVVERLETRQLLSGSPSGSLLLGGVDFLQANILAGNTQGGAAASSSQGGSQAVASHPRKAAATSGASATNASVVITPTATPTGEGWSAFYYNDRSAGDSTVPAGTLPADPLANWVASPAQVKSATATRIDPQADINNVLAKDQPLPARVPNTNFSTVWDGWVQAPKTGYYTFFPASDDGSDMYVDTATDTPTSGTPSWVQIDNNFSAQRGVTADTSPVKDSTGAAFQFQAGQKYHVLIGYEQSGGGYGASLQWAASSTAGSTTYDAVPKANVPTSAVFADVPTAPSTVRTTAAPSDVVVTWNQPANSGLGNGPAASFEVQRSTDTGFDASGNVQTFIVPADYSNGKSNPTETYTYNDTTAVNGTTYFYRVIAQTQEGSSAPSYAPAMIGDVGLTAASYNQDMVVDPNAASPYSTSVSATMDAGTGLTGNTWYAAGGTVATAAGGGGLPMNGTTTNTIQATDDPSTPFTLQPAGPSDGSTLVNNAILLDASNPTYTVNFNTPNSYSSLAFLTSSGNGAGTYTVSGVLASDPTGNTTVPIGTVNAPDWFGGSPVGVSSHGRVDVGANTFNNVGSSNPSLYDEKVAVPAGTGALSGLQFNWTGSGGNTHTAIFAISGGSGEGSVTPKPGTLAAPVVSVTRTSPTAATISYPAVNGATGYTITRATSLNPDGTLNSPTTLATNQPGTTYSDSALTAGQDYFYQVTDQGGAGATSATSAPVFVGHGDGWQATYYASDTSGQRVYTGDQMANVLLNNPDGTPATTPSGAAANITQPNNAVIGFQRNEAKPINYTNGNDTNTWPNAPAGYNSVEGANIGDDMAARWVAYVVPSVTGYYTLLPRSDDGSSITYLDPTSNMWMTLKPNFITNPQGATTDPTPVVDSTGAPSLWTAGQKYEIQMDYNNFGGGWEADLSWEAASSAANQKAGNNDALAATLIPVSETYAPTPTFKTVDAANPSGLAKDQTYYTISSAGNNGSVQLTFSNIGADSYNIYRASGDAAGSVPNTTYAKVGNVSESNGGPVNYTDMGLATSGTKYYYIVTGLDASGESAVVDTTDVNPATPYTGSALTTAATPTPKPPASPTGVTAIPSLNSAGKPQVVISFPAVPFADTYTIQRAPETSPGSNTPGTFTNLPNATGITGTSYTDTDPALQIGQNYFYRVIAHNNSTTVDNGFGVGNSAPSAAVAGLNGAEFHGYNNQFWYSTVQGAAAAGGRSGYTGFEYPWSQYDNFNITPTINLSGNDGQGQGAFGLRADNFSDIISGKIIVTQAGTYQFSAFTDDDGFLVVNGTVVSQNPGGHGVQAPVSGSQVPLTLAPGSYNFEFFHSNGGGGWGIQMHWSATDSTGATIIQDGIVPQSNLTMVEDTPAAPANLAVGTAGPTVNSDGATYSVPMTFDSNAIDELATSLQRSTTANFAPGTYETLPGSEAPLQDHAGGTSPITGVNITDNTAPAGSTLYYRVVAWNFNGTSTPSNIVSVTTPAASTTPTAGVEAHYYNDDWWRSTTRNTTAPTAAGANISPDYSVAVANINENSGNSPPAAAQNVGPNDFSSLFTGKLTITTAGAYQFQTWSDDDSYVYVDGKLASASPGGHGVQAPSYTAPAMQLSAGTHDIEYFQSNGGGGWGYNLEYSGPDNSNAAFGDPSAAGQGALVPGTALTTLSDPVTTPTLTAASGNGNQVVLTWNSQPSVVRYVLERSAKSFSDPTLTDADITTVTLGLTATSYTDSGLNYGQTYHYRLKAENFDSQSAFTADTPGLSGNNLAAPTSLSSSQCDNTIEVGITPPPVGQGGNITGYSIERSTDGGTTWVPAGTAPGNATQFTDSGPTGGFTPGTTYTYRVSAQGTPGNSQYSTATTSTVYQPAGPFDHSHGFGTTLTGVQTDGGFETPAEAYGSYNYNPTGGAWTFNGESGIISPPSAFSAPAPVEGSQVAFLQTNPGDTRFDATNGQYISQAMTFTAGQYVFNDYDAERPGNNAASYEVALDWTPGSTPPTASQIIFTSSPTSTTFTAKKSAPFTVTAGSHTLTLISTGPSTTGSDNTSFIDAVQVTPAGTAPAYFDMQNNGDTQITPAGNPSGNTGRLELTHNVNSQGSSSYEKVQTDISHGFTSSFDFQFSGGTATPADGIAFVVQGNGPTALGGTGGSLGMPTSKSAAIVFDSYGNGAQGGSTLTGAAINGSNPSGGSNAVDMSGALGNVFAPANYVNGATDVLNAKIVYDPTNQVVHETVTDTATGKVFTHDYTGVNLSQIVGSDCAYIGFSGGTGGANQTADVLDWTYTPSTTITTVPVLTGTTIGDGTTQRSEVRSITLNFNEPVTLGTGAVTLSLLNSGGSGLNDGSAPTDASSALGTPTTTDGGMTWTIPFLVSTTYTDKTGSLTNGIYTVTVHASKVSSGGLTMASDSSTTFHRLFGDIDGNKTVNNLDYLKFKKSYGTSTGAANYNANFDYDNNGTINNADYLQFKKDYGKTFTY